MNTNNKITSFVNHLEHEIKLLKELNAILALEKEALSRNQFNDLEPVSLQKETLTEQLETSAKSRTEILKEYSSNEQKPPFHDLLAACNPQQVALINHLNSTMAEELKKCRELNQINGQVIANSLYTRQEIVNLLSGQQTNSTGLYTAEGNIETSSDGGRHQEA